MTPSGRNKLTGKIEEFDLGGVLAHVVIRVGKDLIESVITKRSADEMKLKVGDTVRYIIKSHRSNAGKGLVLCEFPGCCRRRQNSVPCQKPAAPAEIAL